MLLDSKILESVGQVAMELNHKLDEKYKRHQVAKIMKVDMGLQYRKIQTVALHTNSDKNRILRQQFAMQLVTLLRQGKRIINVDESWLSTSDFRSMKWRAHRSNNSLPKGADGSP